MAEDGVVLLTNNVVIGTNQNLMTNAGWDNLLNEVAELSENFQHNYDVLVAVTPFYPAPSPPAPGPPNGVASATISWPPCAVVQVGLTATLAHEVAHMMGVGHATSPCFAIGAPGAPTNIDTRLPSSTEDNGLAIRGAKLIPSQTSELMSYCTPSWAGATYQDRWPSVALWDILFDRLA